MTYDEALSAAILGDRVRAVDMAPGTFIDYNFNGWRINLAGGASSGYTLKEHDKQVEWEVVPIEPPKAVGWGDFKPSPLVNPEPAIAAAKKRRTRGWQPPEEINDIGWGEKPLAPAAVKCDPPAPAKTDSVTNGWAVFDQWKKG